MRSFHLVPCFLLLILLLPFAVLAEGAGEIVIIDNRINVSYDESIRQVEEIRAHDPTDYYPYWIRETDINRGLEYWKEDGRMHIRTYSNPNVFSINNADPFYLCTQVPMRGLIPIPQFTERSYCDREFPYVYKLRDITVGEEYTFNLPRNEYGYLPIQWYLGEGARGGGGCICQVGNYDGQAWIQNTPSSFLVNTQEGVQVAIDYSGGSCNAEVILQYKPVSTWISPWTTGASGNFGGDTADCNSVVCRVANMMDWPTKYTKQIDFQQIDPVVKATAMAVCSGKPWNGHTSGEYTFSIYNDYPVVETNFTNYSNFTTDDTIPFYINVTDTSPHIRFIYLYINGTLNQTQSIALGNTFAEKTFTLNLPAGQYSMYGRARDYKMYYGITETYYFAVTETEESESTSSMYPQLQREKQFNPLFLFFFPLVGFLVFIEKKEKNNTPPQE